MSFEEADEKPTSLCLEKVGRALSLRWNHKLYYQCQGQLNISGYDWLDFVVRRINPYQIYIERIRRDMMKELMEVCSQHYHI